MSQQHIHYTVEDDGVVNVHVSGKLVKEDYESFVPEFDRLVQQHGKVSIIFDMMDFQGWTLGALWEDIKFDAKHYADIERLAIIGDKKWEKEITIFCRPFTRAQIRYFDQADANEARSWLVST